MMNIFDELFLLQRIDHLVRTRATGTPAQLASRLNVSERNLYRLLGDLRDRGFPIAYDKQASTYYYVEPVKLDISIMVGSEKLLLIQGGEKKRSFFTPLPDFGSSGRQFCQAFRLSMTEMPGDAENPEQSRHIQNM